jgi:hypothetical protein
MLSKNQNVRSLPCSINLRVYYRHSLVLTHSSMDFCGPYCSLPLQFGRKVLSVLRSCQIILHAMQASSTNLQETSKVWCGHVHQLLRIFFFFFFQTILLFSVYSCGAAPSLLHTQASHLNHVLSYSIIWPDFYPIKLHRISLIK